MQGFAVPRLNGGAVPARFCLGHIGQLNKALRKVLLLALSLIGVGKAVTLDFDSTYPLPLVEALPGAERCDDLGVQLHAPEPPGEQRLAEGEDPSVGSDEPVPLHRAGDGDGNDR